jgi:hypothetical protein
MLFSLINDDIIVVIVLSKKQYAAYSGIKMHAKSGNYLCTKNGQDMLDGKNKLGKKENRR